MVKEIIFDGEFKMYRCDMCEKDYYSKEVVELCEEECSA